MRAPLSIAVHLVTETVVTLRAARTVLLAAAEAVEAGLLRDLAARLDDVARAADALERVADRLAPPSGGSRSTPRQRHESPALEDALF